MFKKLADYLVAVRTELAKVSWPSRAEMMESTRIILILSFVLALAVFVVDRILTFAIGQLL